MATSIASIWSLTFLLARIVSQNPLVSYFNNILTPDIINLLNTSAELTIFLPVNSAWDALDTYERLYLESGYAVDDLNRILNMHAVMEKEVRYSDSFDSVKHCKFPGITFCLYTDSMTSDDH